MHRLTELPWILWASCAHTFSRQSAELNLPGIMLHAVRCMELTNFMFQLPFSWGKFLLTIAIFFPDNSW